MFRLFTAAVPLLAIAVVLLSISPETVVRAANNSEQVVFSGVAIPGNLPGPSGFWIWCEADSGNPYVGACNGAMYFYELHITKHVSGTVTEASGIYTMDVHSTLDSSVHCMLSNVSATIAAGPANGVTVTCLTGQPAAGTNRTSSAVVRVTGP